MIIPQCITPSDFKQTGDEGASFWSILAIKWNTNVLLEVSIIFVVAFAVIIINDMERSPFHEASTWDVTVNELLKKLEWRLNY